MTNHYIAWWNVENLFDSENAPERSDKLQRTLKNELEGWTEEIRNLKLNQIASIINKMNNNTGPDIIGLCEIENRNVLNLLASRLNRQYEIVHADTDDARGIDVGFLFDKDRYISQEVFFHVVLRRNATRDIVQVNFKVKDSDRLLVIIGNHWPSRSGGQFESEPYRMSAGETLSYYHERILEVLGKDAAILPMGDLNDEPYNRSVTDYALASNNITKVINANNPLFFNLMWEFLAKGEGSFFYDKPNMLDQFFISKGILNGKSGFRYKQGSCKIEIFNGMATNGSYKKPIKFGRPKEGCNFNGYSDHFPISLILEEN